MERVAPIQDKAELGTFQSGLNTGRAPSAR
jgi:hypothetical protein